MSVRLHHIVTGELESSLPVSLLNSGAHPKLEREAVLPFGYRYDIVRRDGTVTEGVMVPVPVWLIEGSEKNILIETGLGDIDEVSEMQSRYGVDFVASRTADQDLVAGLAGLYRRVTADGARRALVEERRHFGGRDGAVVDLQLVQVTQEVGAAVAREAQDHPGTVGDTRGRGVGGDPGRPAR